MCLPERKSLKWYRTNKRDSGIGIVSVRDVKGKNRCSKNANIKVCRASRHPEAFDEEGRNEAQYTCLWTLQVRGGEVEVQKLELIFRIGSAFCRKGALRTVVNRW
jgi:hypothetical protein